MRKRNIPLIVLIIALVNVGLTFSQGNKEEPKFQKILDDYFDALWKFYPTAATLAGYHNYDNKLEDLSSKNREKRHEALDKFNQEFVAKVDRTKLSADLQIDHEIMVNALEFELLRHENLVPWEYNPIFYNTIFKDCIRSLVTKEFAPLDTRAKNAAERLKALPKLIKQAKENLKTPPQIYTQTAIKQFTGIIDFYKNELPQWIDQAPESQKSNLVSNLAKAVPELESYQSFLSNGLLPRSTGSFRLVEAHARLVRVTFQNDLPINDLVARAQADVKNIRRDMVLVSMPFYKIMYPHINMDQVSAQRSEADARTIFIKGVLDKIKGNHSSKEELFNKIIALTKEIKNFLLTNQLVDLPEEILQIEMMPPESQGMTWTQLVSPGAYETDASFSCQIAPIPNELDNAQIESLLEECNDFLLPFWTIRNVFPGQYVPLLDTRKNASLVRKLYPNLPLIKGWPVLIDEMLVYLGYGNYDLRIRLNQLKMRLRTVIDFIVDFNVHQGSWTKEDAVNYMTREGFQTQAEAERKWNYVILNPGDAAYAYVGMQEYLDMEKEYRQLKGDSFSKKEFLSKLLSYGALPLRYLKRKMME